jgi:hypothetical protein
VQRLAFYLSLAALVCGAVVGTSSCSSDASNALGEAGPGGDGGGEAGLNPSDFQDASAIPSQLEANGIVLVHAASYPAFRVCFDGALGARPLPDVDLMPDSNVVGIDVGTALRLPPFNGQLGRAFVFPELAIRSLYPAFGGAGIGPTCQELLLSNKGDLAEVGTIIDDLGSGVHALVLRGCRNATLDPQASVARCGDDWSAATGNLQLQVLPLIAYQRSASVRGLPVQIVQLSPALATLGSGRSLGISFGELDRDGGPAPAPFIEGPVPFGQPVPNPPAVIAYDPTELAAYATSGVFVTVGGLLDGGTPDAGRQIVLAQSLQEIQQRSASRSLPSDWFAVASSYVVLSVGDPKPVLVDGGPDDDPRRALHLLAIPLAAVDAGAPAPAPAGDAGL